MRKLNRIQKVPRKVQKSKIQTRSPLVRINAHIADDLVNATRRLLNLSGTLRRLQTTQICDLLIMSSTSSAVSRNGGAKYLGQVGVCEIETILSRCK